MIYMQKKSVLGAMLMAITITGGAYSMFEVKFDGSDTTINGQSINKAPEPLNKSKILADIGFSCIGGYLASTYLTHEEQPASTRLNTIAAGATAGWITSDILYRKGTAKRALTKVETGVVVLAGIHLLAILAPPM